MLHRLEKRLTELERKAPPPRGPITVIYEAIDPRTKGIFGRYILEGGDLRAISEEEATRIEAEDQAAAAVAGW